MELETTLPAPSRRSPPSDSPAGFFVTSSKAELQPAQVVADHQRMAYRIAFRSGETLAGAIQAKSASRFAGRLLRDQQQGGTPAGAGGGGPPADGLPHRL